MAKCKSLMLQGTGSDVGKTVLVAGLCRLAANMGIKVLPFKPQNMSNNAAVTHGGEIGRAQWLQAKACRVEPSVDMNPILLKPQSEIGAQLIVHGKVQGTATAKQYQKLKKKLLPVVLQSYHRLQQQADLILIEGAGSCAETNLKNDLANMGFACAAKVPVALVADIDRGGVLANIVGTHKLLPANQRKLIQGVIINKFRGDQSLFAGAKKIIKQNTNWQTLGIVHWLTSAAKLPAEDSVVLEKQINQSRKTKKIKIIVPVLSRIANFDELDALRFEPNIDLVFVHPQDEWPPAKLVILCGSKSTIADLQQFRKTGGEKKLHQHIKNGGHVLGICGGYQMLGKTISDPFEIEGQIEGKAKKIAGLGLLDITTKLEKKKTLKQTTAQAVKFSAQVNSYEIHMGKTTGAATAHPMFTTPKSSHQNEGAISPNGKIQGCYLHGLFANDQWRRLYLQSIGIKSASNNFDQMIENSLDNIADELYKIFKKKLFAIAK